MIDQLMSNFPSNTFCWCLARQCWG